MQLVIYLVLELVLCLKVRKSTENMKMVILKHFWDIPAGSMKQSSPMTVTEKPAACCRQLAPVRVNQATTLCHHSFVKSNQIPFLWKIELEILQIKWYNCSKCLKTLKCIRCTRLSLNPSESNHNFSDCLSMVYFCQFFIPELRIQYFPNNAF